MPKKNKYNIRVFCIMEKRSEKMKTILERQKEYFLSGITNAYYFRKFQLLKLKHLIKKNENEILRALKKDLNKSIYEGYVSEISIVYSEIDYHIKNLDSNMARQSVASPLFIFSSKSYYINEPYGQVMIIGPFNYPVQLTLVPLIAAIATGNVISIKMSSQAQETARILTKLLSDNFSQEYINIIDAEISNEDFDAILDYPFDLIFFTGSIATGKIIYQKAANNLTPVILELGGKSPCIVDKDANVKLAAQKIVWGKLLNSGQTCIAPDYLLVHEDVKEELLKQLVFQIEKQYGEDIFASEDYPKMINEKAYQRVISLIDKDKIYYGGEVNQPTLQIQPTIILEDDLNSEIMQEEIFGPVLPVLTFNNIDNEIKRLKHIDKPLALYYFGKKNKDSILMNTSSGGLVINDVLLHITNENLPFGGVGKSGIGAYHGKFSFESFSHQKAVVQKSRFLNPGIRYAPFPKKIKLIKFFLK